MKIIPRSALILFSLAIIGGSYLMLKPASAMAVSNSQINLKKQTVILVIDKDFYDDMSIRSKILRYEGENSDYNFSQILYRKNNNSVTDTNSQGGDIKGNFLEVRNTIKSLYQSNRSIVGVWVIGNIRPTIWRDSSLWRDLSTSGFYPSLYPFTAIDQEYYNSFDVANDGFYEKSGVTRGSAVGDGYNATIWGAALIPPTTNLIAGKDMVSKFFDRDHNYKTGSLKYGNSLLYADTFGCSSKEIANLNSSHKWQNNLLCPNFNDQLQGFNSAYHFIIDTQPDSYNPATVGWMPLSANTSVEISEYSTWKTRSLIDNSVLEPVGSNTYEFYLILRGRSMSASSIKSVIMNNLPTQLCGTRTCNVYVGEAGFRENDAPVTVTCPPGFTCNPTPTTGNLDVWNGYWSSYQTQQNSWTNLYTRALKNNNAQITYLVTHGSPTSHNFGINSDLVKSSNFSSLIYEIEACDTANYLVDNYIAGNYLFNGNALAVSGYSIPFLLAGNEGYYEGQNFDRFMNIGNTDLVINSLFLKNYENSIYFGDPLLRLSPNYHSTPVRPPVSIPATYLKLPYASRGPNVITLQNYLIQGGYLADGNSTGYYGPLTSAALQSYVSQNTTISSTPSPALTPTLNAASNQNVAQPPITSPSPTPTPSYSSVPTPSSTPTPSTTIVCPPGYTCSAASPTP